MSGDKVTSLILPIKIWCHYSDKQHPLLTEHRNKAPLSHDTIYDIIGSPFKLHSPSQLVHVVLTPQNTHTILPSLEISDD